MKKLSFVWPYNRIARHDGDEFYRQAVAYSFPDDQVNICRIPKINKIKRRREILEQVNRYLNVDRVSFFCHGQPKSFDAGFDLSNIGDLGEAVGRAASQKCIVNLFCCKTGKLIDGLAAKLSDYSGRPVVAHSTSGHTTRNPNKWVFYNGDVKPLFQGRKPGLPFTKWTQGMTDKQYYAWLDNVLAAWTTMPSITEDTNYSKSGTKGDEK